MSITSDIYIYIYLYIYTLREPRRGHSRLIGHEGCLCCFDAFGGLALRSCVWSLAGACGSLGGSWASLEGPEVVPRRSWASLGGLWRVPGGAWGFLGGPWASLEGPRGVLGVSGRSLGGPWGILRGP